MKSRICLCVAVLAAALSGCNIDRPKRGPDHMDHRNAVQLDVQKGAVAGYTPTYGSDGQLYSYKFTGGDDKHGNVTVTTNEGNDVKIHVSLNSTVFAIDHVEISDDDGHQLTPPPSNSGNNVVIADAHTEGVALNAYFLIQVTDTGHPPTLKIYCDPRIVNN